MPDLSSDPSLRVPGPKLESVVATGVFASFPLARLAFSLARLASSLLYSLSPSLLLVTYLLVRVSFEVVSCLTRCSSVLPPRSCTRLSSSLFPV